MSKAFFQSQYVVTKHLTFGSDQEQEDWAGDKMVIIIFKERYLYLVICSI